MGLPGARGFRDAERVVSYWQAGGWGAGKGVRGRVSGREHLPVAYGSRLAGNCVLTVQGAYAVSSDRTMAARPVTEHTNACALCNAAARLCIVKLPSGGGCRPLELTGAGCVAAQLDRLAVIPRTL